MSWCEVLPSRAGHRASAACLVVLLATTTAFSPVLQNGFSGWDDAVYVTENPLVAALSWNGIGRIFSTPVSGNYHPLTVLSHALQYRLFGDDPRFHHGVSLLLHLCATALTFRFLLLLSGEQLAAVIGSLFFALHPMRVESVAWITDQKDLLATVFALGALVVHADPGWARRRYRGPLLFALFLAAMLSKATAAVLPLVLLLVDYLRGTLDRRAWAEKVPLFAVAALFGAIALAARWSYQSVLQERAPALGETVSTGLYRLVCYYLARSAAPFTDAFPLYPPAGPAGWAAGPRALVPALAAAALAAMIALSLRWTRKVFFGAAFFALALLPALPVEVLGFSADRFSYLPAIGLAFLAGEGVVWLKARLPGGRAPRAAAVLCLAAMFAALAAGSFRQSRVWLSNETLWTHALDLYPAVPGHAFNRAHAYHNRGLARQKGGDLVGALADLDAAVALAPDRADFLTARGVVRGGLDDPTGAEADFSRAIDTGAVAVAPLIERGILRTRAGAYAGAAVDFEQALFVDPANIAARLNLGILYLESGDYEAARSAFTRLLEQDPGNGPALYGRAVAGSALGDNRGAADDLAQAEALGYPVAPGFREQVRQQGGQAQSAPRPAQP